MQYAGGILLTPVQKLVATIIFVTDENATRVRPPAPINPIVNDTFTMGFIFVPVGLEPQVRVWGARGALPVADEATRASGSGRCTTQPLRRQGVHRAPQQDTGTKTNPTPQGVGFVLLLTEDGLEPIRMWTVPHTRPDGYEPLIFVLGKMQLESCQLLVSFSG